MPQSVPVIHVDDDAPLGGNGTGASPYHNLEDALAKARMTSAAVICQQVDGVGFDMHIVPIGLSCQMTGDGPEASNSRVTGRRSGTYQLDGCHV